jgi:hypothetical protein
MSLFTPSENFDGLNLSELSDKNINFLIDSFKDKKMLIMIAINNNNFILAEIKEIKDRVFITTDDLCINLTETYLYDPKDWTEIPLIPSKLTRKNAKEINSLHDEK